VTPGSWQISGPSFAEKLTAQPDSNSISYAVKVYSISRGWATWRHSLHAEDTEMKNWPAIWDYKIHGHAFHEDKMHSRRSRIRDRLDQKNKQ
jgi:hypothetical protein